MFKAVGTFLGSMAGAAVVVQGVAGLFGSVSIKMFESPMVDMQDNALAITDKIKSFSSNATAPETTSEEIVRKESSASTQLVQKNNAKKTNSSIVLTSILNPQSPSRTTPQVQTPAVAPMAAPVEPTMANPSDAVSAGSKVPTRR